ncbi:terminase-like family protein [Candidatus Thiodiazotropha endolucinida]|uniref:Terminase-like family protein n=2 Tax=Candidatus Thiodiazotropha endolucinida TaxID=1655433 RepID=A0A7Z1AG24_9GAMM|nr:terminase-like family protein [Candidatus Thiodiazotropha endolucinida]
MDPVSRARQLELEGLLQEQLRRRSRRKLESYYPETGPLRRALYPKHLAFFEGGRHYRQRLMLAANRIGKTEGVGLYELVLHLTGAYPAWWRGRRFSRPIRAWAAADTIKNAREILQAKLLGASASDWGTGLIPGDSLQGVSKGATGTVDTIEVSSVSGGTSVLLLKSYEQGRKAFQGTEQDVILLDEEPPYGVYTEALMRTMTTDGLLLLTFTPLQGVSEVVRAFLGDDVSPAAALSGEGHSTSGRWVVRASWDDVPHLSAEVKAELLQSIPAYQRDARSRGVPQLGSGAIYPIPEADFVVSDFEIPAHWPRVYGLDVGWRKTAALWCARDLDGGVDYLVSEHYRGEAEPVVHAAAIKARGDWIPGVIDPAARQRNQKDGERLLDDYNREGLWLTPAVSAVESGIYRVYQALSTGRLKVFGSLRNWLDEYRYYRRDEQGRIVKERDHLMDCTRYVYNSGLSLAALSPAVERLKARGRGRRVSSEGWMG